METASEIPKLKFRIGKDGKSYSTDIGAPPPQLADLPETDASTPQLAELEEDGVATSELPKSDASTPQLAELEEDGAVTPQVAEWEEAEVDEPGPELGPLPEVQPDKGDVSQIEP